MRTLEENYIDVTEKCLKKAIPNSQEEKEQNYFEYNGVKYVVDGKKVVLDYSVKEKEVAEWIRELFGGKIYL